MYLCNLDWIVLEQFIHIHVYVSIFNLCFLMSLFDYFRVLSQVIFLKLFNQQCLRVVRFLTAVENLLNTHVRNIK